MTDSVEIIRCDSFGCEETHPVHHEYETDPGYRFGKWIGWLYLDINRPDLIDRSLRFCSVLCLRWWLDRETVSRRSWEQPQEPPRELRPNAVKRILRAESAVVEK